MTSASSVAETYADHPRLPWDVLGVLVVIAAGLGIARVAGVTHPAFQAAAHLYVGGLLGGWIATRDRPLLWLAGGLSVLEVAAAVHFRILGR